MSETPNANTDSLGELEKELKNELIVKRTPEEYSVKDFRQAFSLLTELIDDKNDTKAFRVIESFIERNPNCFLYNYYLGSLRYRTKRSDENLNAKLLGQANNLPKRSILVHLAKEMLNYTESLSALTFLGGEIQKENDKEELLEVWVRTLKIDPENTALPKKIAELKEKIGQTEEAIHYYKIAFVRNYESKDFEAALNLWKQLSKLNPTDIGFYMSYGRKFAQQLDSEDKKKLFKNIVGHYERDINSQAKELLVVLKFIIKNKLFQENLNQILIRAYSSIHRKHPHLEDFLTISGLNQTQKNITKGIEIFESHIKYDVGSFVQHKGFGIGVIRSIDRAHSLKINEVIQKTTLIIDFERHRRHSMSMRIAISALHPLPKDHLVATKRFDPEAFREMLLGPAEDLAAAGLNTIGKPASQKDIRELFVPGLVAEEQWPALWKRLKEVLHGSPQFDFKNNHYDFHQDSGRVEQETLKRFQTSSSLEKRSEQIEFYFMHSNQHDPKVVRVFTDYLKACASKEDPNALKALLVLEQMARAYNLERVLDFQESFARLATKELITPALFSALKTNSLRLLLLESLAQLHPKLYTEVVRNLLESPEVERKQALVEHFLNNSKPKSARQLYEHFAAHYTKFPEAYIVFAKIVLQSSPFALEQGKGYLFLKVINLFEQLYKDPTLSGKVLHGKKLFLFTQHLLFDESFLFDYLKSETDPTLKKDVFQGLENLHFLEPHLKLTIRERSEKYQSP